MTNKDILTNKYAKRLELYKRIFTFWEDINKRSIDALIRIAGNSIEKTNDR